MIKTLYAPYLLPSSETLKVSPWKAAFLESGALRDSRNHLSGNSKPNEVPIVETDQFWTPGFDVTASTSISIDVTRVLSECGLSDETKLGIAVSWFGKDSKIRELLHSGPALEKQEVTITLPGDKLMGHIEVITDIYLMSVPSQPQIAGIACNPGSLLLEDIQQATFGSSTNGFPTAIVDFTNTIYHSLASWHLETSFDLYASFSSSYQLLINERDKLLVKAIENEKPTREQNAVLNEMTSGVVEILLEIGIHFHEELFETTTSFPPGSVGEALKSLLERADLNTFLKFDDPSSFSRRRTYLSGLARELSAGRPL